MKSEIMILSSLFCRAIYHSNYLNSCLHNNNHSGGWFPLREKVSHKVLQNSISLCILGCYNVDDVEGLLWTE